MAKNYNRNNCDSTLRATVTDAIGRTVSLSGTPAFKWSTVTTSDRSITINIKEKDNGRHDKY